MTVRNYEKTSFSKAKKLPKRTNKRTFTKRKKKIKKQQQKHKTCNAIIDGNSVYQHLLKCDRLSGIFILQTKQYAQRTVDRNDKCYI